MQNALRQKAFKYVAALAVAGGMGLFLPGPRLLRIPERLMGELLDAVEEREPSWPKEDRRRVLLLLAQDPRPQIRSRVAEAASALMPDWSEDANRLLFELALDPIAEVRTSASRGLEALLKHVTPIERVEVLCQWAAAAEVARREALGLAMCAPITTLITDLVIEELSRDVNPRVRLAALRAAQHHYPENPAAYAAIAQDRADDEDARVRRAAKKLLVESV
jgi:hypothetical protein